MCSHDWAKKYILGNVNKQKIIDMCENVEWDYPKNTTQCEAIIKQLSVSKKLHSKTISLNKDITTRHLVLGASRTERYSIFNLCNKLFIGKAYGVLGKPQCGNLVGWNIVLNKYYVLSAYYKKSSFIRVCQKVVTMLLIILL